MQFTWILCFLGTAFCYNEIYSFVSPFGKSLLENWDFYGSVEIQQNKIILIPSAFQSKIASIWSKNKNIYEEWSVEISLRLTNLEHENSGLALWYTSEKGKGGIVFGSKDRWDGLGIFLYVGQNKRPSLRGHLNDGSMEYSRFKNPSLQAFGACSIIHQNTSEILTFKLLYSKGAIQVEQKDSICFKTTQINLPPDYYFGISTQSMNDFESFEIYNFQVNEIKNKYSNSEEKTYTHIEKETANIDYNFNLNITKILNDLPTFSHQLLNITNEQLIIKTLLEDINQSLYSLSETIFNLNSKSHNNKKEAIDTLSDEILKLIPQLSSLKYQHRNETLLMIDSLSETVSKRILSINSGIKFFIIINIIMQILIFLTYIVYKRRTDDYPRKIL
ncbi:uncharacterized protein T551_02875 [Pneumocystis jirovecii RU7]|uniref:L-type lectin-like domain-containing protein n=1 Tax=Pneumocystis jirovecii (strain RU7) TaxID=1408657 RepID=A0A0W4ZHQ6_PNEJ7|nr:uncharacterized protein T551_02875 [Pneumocystis jirovecii RU7]KTW27908.1 hypothetical protein T551_02875 [Pneumocystis jirovecii RU7]